jgi:hypothetical protein
VVGSSVNSLDLAGSEQTIYETPYSLLDNISPAYRCQPLTLRQEFGRRILIRIWLFKKFGLKIGFLQLYSQNIRIIIQLLLTKYDNTKELHRFLLAK